MRNIFKKTKELSTPLNKWIQDTRGSQDFPLSIQKLNNFYIKYQDIFTKQVSSTIKLESDDDVCSIIANDCYRPKDQRPSTIENFSIVPGLNTEMIAVYENKQSKICIFGLRGTVITNLKDIASDAQIVLDINGIDPRVGESLQMYDTLKREYPEYKIYVCGHSLGGTLSYIVAKHRNPERCVVFNPGIAFNTFFFQMLEDTLKKEDRTEKTYTYKILGDIVSTIAFVGHTKVFKIKATDPLKLHAMDNFIHH